LIFQEYSGKGAFFHTGAIPDALMACAGIVTSVPLLFFAAAARRITLSLVGIIQYISPTLQFLLGVLIYGESFTRTQFIGFSAVWIALIIIAFEGLWHQTLKGTSQSH
jgi:chloramphenicol-sensitive protein RarD